MTDANQQLSMTSETDELKTRVARLEEHLLHVEAAIDALKNERRVSFAIGDSKLN